MTLNLQYSTLALIAGVGIPIMASISAALGARLASTTAAATILFFGAFALTFAAMLIQGIPTKGLFSHVPTYLYAGGAFIAFYVLSITWLIPRLGVGNAIFLVLLGQIISASIIDHFGLFNTKVVPFSITKLLGVVLMVFGIFLARKL